MRNAMKAADEARRFDRIGFDTISLHSEYAHRLYSKPSENIMAITEELNYLHDKRNTEYALEKIE